MNIVLISCVKKKAENKCQAKDMYISSWFQKAYRYAKEVKRADKIFILSAKYGLLKDTDIVEPYDETLKTKSRTVRKKWADDVIEKLKAQTDFAHDKFVVLAGMAYREYLFAQLPNEPHAPLAGKRIGEQMKFLGDEVARRSKTDE